MGFLLEIGVKRVDEFFGATRRGSRTHRTDDSYRRRGATAPRPPGPIFHSGKKMKFTKGNIDLGYFWYTNFWVPSPLPSPLSPNPCLYPPESSFVDVSPADGLDVSPAQL